MKVERKLPGFRPITITLESEHEASSLLTVLGNVSGSYAEGTLRHATSELHKALVMEDVKAYPHTNTMFDGDEVDLSREA